MKILGHILRILAVELAKIVEFRGIMFNNAFDQHCGVFFLKARVIASLKSLVTQVQG
jgi:hypothetical protein